MEMNYLTKSSFEFEGVDMFLRFGIQLVDEPGDVIQPKLRERKLFYPSVQALTTTERGITMSGF